MSSQESVADILNKLSPEAKELVARVHQLEKENLHLKTSTLLTTKIIEAVKELAK
ncbi:hypothetical protein ACIG5E_37140 [Kitasatospora sp. NPDC053057]|uniref:hypothetical protein n=1 Tax=Kitasatospora sp. NPDC053057 TaxID=3364062 RepID=UPI0037CB4604